MNQFKLTFQLEKPFLPKSLEPLMLSFLKEATLNYSREFHISLYDKSRSIMKSYTFSYYLPNAKFQKEQISLGMPCFEAFFSDANLAESIQLLNSFNTMYGKSYPMNCNSMKFVSVTAQKRNEITDSEIIVKMLSSLIVRRHNSDDNSDIYYTYEDDEFGEVLRENVMQRHMIKLYEQEFNLEEIAEESKTKKVLVICNTVKKAQETYRVLEEYTDNVYSLHARYIKKHRKMLEKNIMQFSENRESVGIWVTTQIVEASLDIDFDILYTEMCTADSLLQRMGRYNRKGRYIPLKPNIKIYKTENAKRQVKNRIKNTEIYYRDLFERSWEYLGVYENRIFTEEQKINYINEVYDTEKIVKTEYFKEIEAYLEYFQELSVNELSKMDGKKKFRMIESVSVMPDKIYNENEDFIEKYQSEIYDRYLGREVKEILKTKLDELTLSITIYNKYTKEGIDGVIEKTDIHRTDFVYDFDEETGKGIGLSKTEREGNIL